MARMEDGMYLGIQRAENVRVQLSLHDRQCISQRTTSLHRQHQNTSIRAHQIKRVESVSDKEDFRRHRDGSR